jgi:MFS family permease
VVSILLFGALAGSAMGGQMAGRVGRRTTILLAGSLYWQGTLLEAFANSITVLLAGRFIVGVAVGWASMAVPLYIAELSPKKYRGSLVACSEFAISSGILLAFLVNYFFQFQLDGWRWMLGLASLLALSQFLLVCMLPESPRFLFAAGKEQSARAILGHIRSPGCWCPSTSCEQSGMYTPVVDAEISEYIQEQVHSQEDSRSVWLQVCQPTPAVRRALVIGIGLTWFQQLTGQPTLIYYSASVFAMAGFNTKAQVCPTVDERTSARALL